MFECRPLPFCGSRQHGRVCVSRRVDTDPVYWTSAAYTYTWRHPPVDGCCSGLVFVPNHPLCL